MHRTPTLIPHGSTVPELRERCRAWICLAQLSSGYPIVRSPSLIFRTRLLPGVETTCAGGAGPPALRARTQAGDVMRRIGGKWQCALCGGQLDVPPGRTPQVQFHAATGKRTERVVVVQGKEVHRCTMPTGHGARLFE